MHDTRPVPLASAPCDAADPTASPLDCPPWSALTTAHRRFAEGGPLALRYSAEVAPFGASAERTEECFSALLPLVPDGGRVALQTFDPFVPPAPYVIERQA